MQQSQPIRVIARVRARKDESDESCISVEGKLLVVNPTTAGGSLDAPSSVSRRQSMRRSSITGGRKSSIGCSSLIPRTPHTPRGLLRNVLSVFPVMDEQSAIVAERFQLYGIMGEESAQSDVFNMVVTDVQAAVDGYRSTVLCYGVEGSGKSYTLWGTKEEKGLTVRALEFIFAHIPEGTKVAISFVGLDDTSCLDYLVDAKQPTEILAPVFRDGADGGKAVQKATSLIVNDAESAWDLVFSGLGKMRSDYHQILTITLNVPSPNGGCVIGTLQIGEICLPATDEPMTRNISNMHDIVRELVDKKYEGSVDYGKSHLTTMLQPAFGGNSRTVVFLNVHPTLQHYHNTIATLSFGEHCSKLKNVISPHIVQGVSNPSHLVGSTPADLVRQVNEYCAYVEELEAENDELRDRCKAWEARVADGDRRHNLALSRVQEGYATQMAEARVAVEELQLQLDSEKLITNGQILIIARQEKMLQRLGASSGAGLVEVDNSQVEDLVSKVQELERKLAEAQRINRGSRIGILDTPSSAPEVPANLQFLQAQLRRVQAENEALKRSLSAADQGRGMAVAEEEEFKSLGEQELRARVAKQKIALAKRDEEMREMREEMRLKEEEMEERERQVEELSDRCDVLRSQLFTVKLLKASATNVSGRPTSSTQQQEAAKAEVANRIKNKAKAQAQAKLNGVGSSKPQQVPVQKKRTAIHQRPVVQQQQQQHVTLSEEEEEEEQEEEEEEVVVVPVAKPKKKRSAPPKPKPVAVEEEEEDEVIEAPRPAVVAKKKKVARPAKVAAPSNAAELPPKKAAQAKKASPVHQADSQATQARPQPESEAAVIAADQAPPSPPRGGDLIDPLDSALLRLPEQAAREIEKPPMPLAPPPQPSRATPRGSGRRGKPGVDLNTSSFFGPTESLLSNADEESEDNIVTPAPKKKAAPKPKAASKKRVSPDENAKVVDNSAPAAAAAPGRKKLMNVKKQRGADFRKSLAATPGSVHPAKKQSRAVEKLTGVTDYGSMLESVLNEGLFALKTPAK